MSPSTTKNFFKTACYFEGSLIVVAVIIGWLTEINPFWNIYFSEEAIFYGIIGTLPLLLFFLISEKLPFKSFKKIKNLLEESLAKDLYHYHWTDLFILAAIAGISEEILFRGALQPWLEQSLGLNEGLVVSSLIFGLVHAVTPLYAVLATLISLYLGFTLDYGEARNLLTPIIIHALYDFFAFIILIRNYRKNNSH